MIPLEDSHYHRSVRNMNKSSPEVEVKPAGSVESVLSDVPGVDWLTSHVGQVWLEVSGLAGQLSYVTIVIFVERLLSLPLQLIFKSCPILVNGIDQTNKLLIIIEVFLVRLNCVIVIPGHRIPV